MKKTENKTYTCQHCGAEADLSLEGFDSVEDVLKRKKRLLCRSCGQEIVTVASSKETYTCSHCGAEADMTLEGFEGVEEVIKRGKKLTCKACGQEMPWTEREDLKAIKMAMAAEKKAYQDYSKAAKKTKNPKGKDMFQQLSDFELNHYQKLKELLQSLENKGEWILYSGTSLKKRTIASKGEQGKGQEQLTDLDALKMAIQEEKKAHTYYRSMAELTKESLGRDMYKRLADEEALHEKVLNDQYYSLHNTGVWSWGD